jgi:hypothetical protein
MVSANVRNWEASVDLFGFDIKKELSFLNWMPEMVKLAS